MHRVHYHFILLNQCSFVFLVSISCLPLDEHHCHPYRYFSVRQVLLHIYQPIIHWPGSPESENLPHFHPVFAFLWEVHHHHPRRCSQGIICKSQELQNTMPQSLQAIFIKSNCWWTCSLPGSICIGWWVNDEWCINIAFSYSHIEHVRSQSSRLWCEGFEIDDQVAKGLEGSLMKGFHQCAGIVGVHLPRQCHDGLFIDRVVEQRQIVAIPALGGIFAVI